MTLYIVPTPIGNLEDMTLRGLRVLREVALIAAEDTRTSRVLLAHYDITTPLTSYHEHNKLAKLESIFDALATGDVALISDAGTPGISDPGYELVKAAIAAGHRVEALPGANAIIPAVVGSGLPADSFIYAGFLPKKAQAKRDFLTALVDENRTVVVYESPNRLVDTLQVIADILGEERPVCVARELSKKFEEFQRGAVGAVLAHYEATPPRGEITLVIGAVPPQTDLWDAARVEAALQARLAAGESRSAAAKAIASESGWKKRDVYQLDVSE